MSRFLQAGRSGNSTNADRALRYRVVPTSMLLIERGSVKMMKRLLVAASVTMAILFLFIPGLMVLYFLDH
jgi:hypothetical protein